MDLVLLLLLYISSLVLSDSINIEIIVIVNYYRDSESAMDPVTVVELLAMETAYNPLLVLSF